MYPRNIDDWSCRLHTAPTAAQNLAEGGLEEDDWRILSLSPARSLWRLEISVKVRRVGSGRCRGRGPRSKPSVAATKKKKHGQQHLWRTLPNQ